MDKKQKLFMWYKVKELWEEGLNKSQISRELGIDRGTIGISQIKTRVAR